MSDWNKPKQPQRGSAASQRRSAAPGAWFKANHPLLKGALAGAVVVLVALGAVYFFMLDSKPKVEIKESTKPRRIKEVVPAPARTNAVDKAGEKLAEVKPYVETYVTNADYEVMKYINGKKAWMFPHRISRHGENHVKKDPKSWDTVARVFPDQATREIGYLVQAMPGEEFGTWLDFHGFTERFLKSLETPIVPNKDDSEEDIALKNEVNAMRKYLKELYDNGEDLDKAMEDARSEMNELRQYKAELEKQIDKIIKEKTNYTEADVEDAINAANMMLQSRGAGQITNGKALVRRFKNLQRVAPNRNAK